MIIYIFVNIINFPKILLGNICFIITKMKQNTVTKVFEILNNQNNFNGFNV